MEKGNNRAETSSATAEKRKREAAGVARFLAEKDDWLVVCHEKPDGDTLGCLFTLVSVGRKMGKNVRCGGKDPVPRRYEFMLGEIGYEDLTENPGDLPSGALIVCVDTSGLDRSVAWLAEESSRHTIINIDHHGDNTMYGTVNWVDPDASATGEMILDLLEALDWELSEDEATALYVSMVTDNGCFSYASVSERSHECAGKLICAGASPSRITTLLDSNLSGDILRLWGRAFSRTELFESGIAASFWLDAADFDETGTTRADTESLVNFLLRIKGVLLAVFCTGNGENVRVSLRTKEPFSAREIAASFGGGGHDLAAGCTIEKNLPEALDLMKDEIRRHVERRRTVAE